MAEKLTCSSCNFKWTTPTGKVPTTCPYCGRVNSIVDLDGSKAKFVDVDDLLK